MMSTVIKRISIQTGLYRPARWTSRFMRPTARREHRAQVEFYRALIAPGSLCFDVGANIGEKSEALLAAGGRVVAFEPNPEIIPELEARCAGPHWSLLRTAMGAAPAVLTLHIRSSHGQSSLIATWGNGDVLRTHAVPVLPLDAAVAAFGVPAYCKIDVEGWELDVLKGLGQPLPLISFEIHMAKLGPARACLERVARSGSMVNGVAGEATHFAWDAWQPLAEILAGWDRDPFSAFRQVGYGDVYVRTV